MLDPRDPMDYAEDCADCQLVGCAGEGYSSDCPCGGLCHLNDAAAARLNADLAGERRFELSREGA